MNTLGMINGIKSIRNDEESTWLKYIGAFGNILLWVFTVIMFLVIWMDVDGIVIGGRPSF